MGNSAFNSELANSDNISALITAVRIPVGTLATDLTTADCVRFCNWTENITIEEPDNPGGDVYAPFPMQVQPIKTETQKELPTLQITMPITSEIAKILSASYLSVLGRPVTIYVTNKELLDSAAVSKFVRYVFYISNFTLNNNVLAFSLSSRFNIFSLKAPRRRFYRNYCPWIYQGDNCPYTTIVSGTYFNRLGIVTLVEAEDICGKTIRDCRLRQEAQKVEAIPWITLPFGGYPTVPSGDPRRV